MTANRLGVPAREVEHAVPGHRLGIAPRMRARAAVGRAERCALKLRFGGEPRIAPPRVRVGFRLADVHRPGERQRNQLEHAAPVPVTSILLPEQRMAHRIMLQPRKVVRPPPARVAVAAGVDELQERGVRHVVALDRERRHLRGRRGELVVPAERHGVAIDAECRASTRHVYPIRRGDFPADSRSIVLRRAFVRERETMPHVQERLLMHGFVLENREHRFAAIEQRMAGAIEIRIREHVQHADVRLVGELLYG